MYEPSAGRAASYLTLSICGFLSLVNMEEVRTGERLKMRHWLTNAIESGDFDGVEWTDKSDGKFRVPWKHASRHGWDIDRDASIFKMWAIYTGKYSSKSKHLTEKEKRSLAKLWKANFRCALNALQDIQVLKGEGKSRGRDAYKVFRLLQPKKQTNKFTKVRSVSASDIDKQEDKRELQRASSLPVQQAISQELDDLEALREIIKKDEENRSSCVMFNDHDYYQQPRLGMFSATTENQAIPELQQTNSTDDSEMYAHSDLQDSDSIDSNHSSDTDMPPFSVSGLLEFCNRDFGSSSIENIVNERSEMLAVITQPVNYQNGFFCGQEDILSPGINSKAQYLRNDPNLYSGYSAFDQYTLANL